ncbi:MAG: diguanylate cyclase domain-containing protein, partial [Actinomycetes bacterium]
MSVIGALPRPSTRTTVLWLVAVPTAGAVTLLPVASYLVRIVTAIAAAAVMLHAARRHQDGLGRARRFFASALLVGAAAGLAAATHILVTGHPAASGWLADWVHLGYAPLAVLGVLCVPRTAGPHGSSLRELADGAVAAGSLWYITRLLIESQGLSENLEGAGKVTALAYPLIPAFVAAMFLSAIPRVVPASRPFLSRMALGIAVLAVAKAALSIASWQQAYAATWWIAALNEVGLLLILGAALLGPMPALARHDRETQADVDATRGVIVYGAPFAPLVVAIAAAFHELVAGRGIPASQMAPLLLVGIAVVIRHIASARETSRLVSRLAARERAARQQARTDPLTGLHNRTAFVDHLDEVLCDATAHPVAVALLDLNDFKDINDTHGHDTGDEVLRQTADRLQHAVPHGGVARLGGDEFAAFVSSSPDGGQSLAAEIVDAFTEPIRVGRRFFQVRPSVGVVIDERPAGAAKRGDG